MMIGSVRVCVLWIWKNRIESVVCRVSCVNFLFIYNIVDEEISTRIRLWGVDSRMW